MLERIWEYLSRNIKIAWKSVFFNFKQYCCFFAAIFIIQLLFGMMAISAINNNSVEYQQIKQEQKLELDEVDEDLAEIEDIFYEDEDEFDEEEFSVECPKCGDLIYLDLETLEECDKITCPGCNEEIEIEFDCDCENCSDCCED